MILLSRAVFSHSALCDVKITSAGYSLCGANTTKFQVKDERGKIHSHKMNEHFYIYSGPQDQNLLTGNSLNLMRTGLGQAGQMGTPANPACHREEKARTTSSYPKPMAL